MNLALNPFDKGKKPEKVDEVVLEKTILDAYRQYTGLLNKDLGYKYGPYIRSLIEIPYLRPIDIELLIHAVISNNKISPRYGSAMLGVYITKLIETSYEHGHNEFILNIGDYAVDELCMLLRAGSDKRPNISVYGNVGNSFAKYATNIKAKVDGSVGRNCAENVEGCKITILADAGSHLGSKASNSTFYVKGKVTDHVGKEAVKSTFRLRDVRDECGAGAKDSWFYVHNAKSRLGMFSERCYFRVFGKKEEDCGFQSNSTFVDKDGNDLMKVRKPKVNYDPMRRYKK